MPRGHYPRTPEWRAKMREIMLAKHARGLATRVRAEATTPEDRKEVQALTKRARERVAVQCAPDEFWARFDAMWLGRRTP